MRIVLAVLISLSFYLLGCENSKSERKNIVIYKDYTMPVISGDDSLIKDNDLHLFFETGFNVDTVNLWNGPKKEQHIISTSNEGLAISIRIPINEIQDSCIFNINSGTKIGLKVEKKKTNIYIVKYRKDSIIISKTKRTSIYF